MNYCGCQAGRPVTGKGCKGIWISLLFKAWKFLYLLCWRKKDHPSKINATSIGLITDALDILYMNYFVIKTEMNAFYLLINDQQFRLLYYDFEPNWRRINWIKFNKHKKYTKILNWIPIQIYIGNPLIEKNIWNWYLINDQTKRNQWSASIWSLAVIFF